MTRPVARRDDRARREQIDRRAHGRVCRLRAPREMLATSREASDATRFARASRIVARLVEKKSIELQFFFARPGRDDDDGDRA
jgi:hypothetical protein